MVPLVTTEITLKEHLKVLGWGAELLDQEGSHVRLGVTRGAASIEACFELFHESVRLTSSKTLPIRKVITPGMKIKFSSSLLNERYGDGGGWLTSLVKLWDLVTRSRLASSAVFEGFVEAVSRDKQFSQFPFDRTLTVFELAGFGDMLYKEDDGTVWRIANAALAHVTEIMVLIDPDASITQPA